MRAGAAALLIAAAVTTPGARAAERRWGIGSFDRLRVEGPLEVEVAGGTAPRATARADDPALLERVRLENNGGTMVVRLAPAARPGGAGGVAKVTLSTPRLSGVALTAPARVSVAGLRGDRATLSVTGTGTLAVSGVEAQSLAATLIGTGSVILAGRAANARLVTNGPGLIDAAALTANDLVVQLDGAGETRAAARYNAQVTSTGLGRVTVSGNPRCSVRAIANGPVSCGLAASR